MLGRMPELPEVETTRRGLEPLIRNQRIRNLVVREPRLRWPIASDLPDRIQGRKISSVSRRGKYLLVELDDSSLLIHLGMSGSLRLLQEPETPLKHDHYDLVLESGDVVRYNDPRRFGSLHLTADPGQHALLRNLGPEPLEPEFNGEYLVHHSTFTYFVWWCGGKRYTNRNTTVKDQQSEKMKMYKKYLSNSNSEVFLTILGFGLML